MSDGLHIRKLPLRHMAWMDRAECKADHVDPDWFFVEATSGKRITSKEGSLLNTEKIAKAVCLRCPVLDECLDFIIEHEMDGHTSTHGVGDGIWGGVTPNERRKAYMKVKDKEGRFAALRLLVIHQGDDRTKDNPLGLGLMGRKV